MFLWMNKSMKLFSSYEFNVQCSLEHNASTIDNIMQECSL